MYPLRKNYIELQSKFADCYLPYSNLGPNAWPCEQDYISTGHNHDVIQKNNQILVVLVLNLNNFVKLSEKIFLKVVTEKSTCIALCLCHAGASLVQQLNLQTSDLWGSCSELS